MDDLVSRCIARATRLPLVAVFSHLTAAILWELPLPRGLADGSQLHVTVPAGRRAPQGKTTRGHQAHIDAHEVTAVRAVAVTTPARTFCDLADYLRLDELVAVGDAILRRKLCSRDELHAATGCRSTGRHRRILARALELLDPRAESPKESQLRVLLIEAGFTPPVPNVEVFDDDGNFVARVDLAYPDHLIAVEYEGDHHRDRAQWQRDLARRRRLEALGWRYLTVTQTDLRDPTALLADLRAALAA